MHKQKQVRERRILDKEDAAKVTGGSPEDFDAIKNSPAKGTEGTKGTKRDEGTESDPLVALVA